MEFFLKETFIIHKIYYQLLPRMLHFIQLRCESVASDSGVTGDHNVIQFCASWYHLHQTVAPATRCPQTRVVKVHNCSTGRWLMLPGLEKTLPQTRTNKILRSGWIPLKFNQKANAIFSDFQKPREKRLRLLHLIKLHFRIQTIKDTQ